MKVVLACVIALGLASCAAGAPSEETAITRVVTEGRTVYVVDSDSEQAARGYAVSACRAKGGSAVFVGVVQYRYKRRATKAVQFDCTS